MITCDKCETHAENYWEHTGPDPQDYWCLCEECAEIEQDKNMGACNLRSKLVNKWPN